MSEGFTQVSIRKADLKALKDRAVANNRSAASELHVILLDAGIVQASKKKAVQVPAQ